MGKRKAEAGGDQTNKQAKVVVQGGIGNASSTAAAARAASAASGWVTAKHGVQQQQQHAQASVAPQLAVKERLAAQIAVKEKVLKLLQKQKAAADPATRSRLQQKLDRILGRPASLQGTSSTAAAAAAAGGGQKVQHQSTKQQQPQPQQKRHPLAGIAPVPAVTPAELARRAERQQRFAADLASIQAATSSNGTAGSGKRGGGAQGHGRSSAAAESEQAIGSGWLALHGGFGTNQALEKEYLRLTSVPKAEDVRPPEVLEKSLALIKRRWKKERCSYAYACSQLKSIRQDLTVQGVATELTRDAYETHARIALEAADLAEFRQCLARLKQLYRAGVDGNRAEFWAYSILHAASLGTGQLSQELCQLPRDVMDDPLVTHALATVNAYRTGQYALFMTRYGDAQRMAPYLMDALLPRIRAAGLSAMLTAYHPCRVPVMWAAQQLGFDTDQPEEAVAYLQSNGVVVDLSAMEIDTKATRATGRAQ